MDSGGLARECVDDGETTFAYGWSERVCVSDKERVCVRMRSAADGGRVRNEGETGE